MAPTAVQVSEDRRAADPNAFPTPAAFLAAVKTAGQGGPIDPALRKYAVAGSDEQGAYSDPHGGFFVPTSLAPIVPGTGADDDPSLGRMLPVPMTTPRVFVNARTDKNHTTSVSGGLVVSRHLETEDLTPSRFQMDQILLEVKDAAGLTFATNDVVTDSFPAFVAVLEAAYRDEFAALFLEERIHGTGVGEFLGVLRSPALITVDKEAGQVANTIVAENVIAIRRRSWRYRQAVWIANHDALGQLMRLVVPIGTAGVLVPAWRPGNDEDGTPDTLLGRPLFYCESASPLGAVGDLMLINWSQYLDGSYRPFEGVSSIHVRFLANEHAFRFTVRNDGAPWWRSALTPKRSTLTLSPYVTLAERA